MSIGFNFKRILMAAVAATSLLAASSAARATIVMQSIANLDVKPTGTAYSGASVGEEFGEQVLLKQAANLDLVVFALSAEIALPKSVTMTMYVNGPGSYGANQLGAVAWQQTFSASSWSAVSTHNDSYLVTVNPVGMDLKANTKYDLVFSGAANSPLLLATYNVTAGGNLDSFGFNTAWGGWYSGTNGQDLGIILDPIGGGSLSAVPEPSSWALMIAGFGSLMLFSKSAAARRRVGVAAQG